MWRIRFAWRHLLQAHADGFLILDSWWMQTLQGCRFWNQCLYSSFWLDRLSQKLPLKGSRWRWSDKERMKKEISCKHTESSWNGFHDCFGEVKKWKNKLFGIVKWGWWCQFLYIKISMRLGPHISCKDKVWTKSWFDQIYEDWKQL